MKDEIIKLDNSINYYVLEEIEYNNKKYILALECNLEEDKVNEEDYHIMEIKDNNNILETANIEDETLATIVTKLLLEKVRNTN